MGDPAHTVGMLLAAGAGRRAGGPKALRIDPDGTSWLRRSVRTLSEGGCDTVLVVLGCAAEQARSLLRGDDLDRVTTVVADGWASGLAASLRTGLQTALADDPQRVLVHLVDLPDVGPDVVRRVLEVTADAHALARAAYAGRPGHPVLIGRAHLPPLLRQLRGDRGAGRYLRAHGARLVECGDLATGEDRDEADAGA